jgi:hypothetical protein
MSEKSDETLIKVKLEQPESNEVSIARPDTNGVVSFTQLEQIFAREANGKKAIRMRFYNSSLEAYDTSVYYFLYKKLKL